jgi:hypothetical protein
VAVLTSLTALRGPIIRANDNPHPEQPPVHVLTQSTVQTFSASEPASIAVSAQPQPSACVPAPNADIARREADWILRSALDGGALSQYPDRSFVNPYLANYAALGLARATLSTCDDRYVEAAWRHLAWYASAMDQRGYVHDQSVVNGQPRVANSMDSTDAYAGTFLAALSEAFRADPDLPRLTTFRPAIARAIGAIASTTRPNGLTDALPTWPVVYLMDQAETVAGLDSAVGLARKLGDDALANDAAARGKQLRTSVEQLWNPAQGSYDWAVHRTGVRTTTSWATAYPDVMQQGWITGWRVVDPQRLIILDQRVRFAVPHLEQPGSLATIDGRRGRLGFWPVALWATAGRDSAVGASWARELEHAADNSQRAWPFNVGIAGQLIVLGSGGWNPSDI